MIAVLGSSRAPVTTATLGLARALAGTTPVLVVDVDSRAPTVHAAVGVDRVPTLAALAGDTPVSAVVHRHPDATGVGVLPAPLESEAVALRGAFDRLADRDATVVVDCPIGAGPRVADVLASIDCAVAVLDPGVDRHDPEPAAVSLARRFDVPTVAVVVPGVNGSADDVDVVVDECPVVSLSRTGPTRDSVTARAAFDAVADTVKAKNYAIRTAIPNDRMVGRLQTGIDVLDRKLDGGLPPGCVVAYTASPASQSELLLYELTAARGTLYLTTERSDDVVRHALERTQTRVGSPTVRSVSASDPLAETRRFVGALPDGKNLIVDTMDVVERSDREDYRALLNSIKTRMLETGSIAILHCLKGETVPENRSTTEHMADAVFDLETRVGTTQLENYLTIPKFRAGGAPAERIKLELSDEVTIDTSRDIA